MNRHNIKNKDSNFILSLIGLFAERPLLLKLRRILMGFIPFLQLQSQVMSAAGLPLRHTRAPRGGLR